MRLISLYLDHSKVGCGWREYLVLKEGPKWTKLISTATADAITIPSTEMKWARDVPLKKTRAARRLRAVAKTYGVDSVALKEALSGLR